MGSRVIPGRTHAATMRSGPATARSASPGGIAAPAVVPALNGTADFSAIGGDVMGSMSTTGPVQSSAAVVGASILTSARDYLGILTPPSLSNRYGSSSTGWVADFAAFFHVPASEYYWRAYVAASQYKGRFVAVLPSADPGTYKGWLNVAVSTTTNAAGVWRRFRIPMPNVWTDRVSIGVSDDKVVLAANGWNLDAVDGLGNTFKGSSIRVADWADLLDGGTLTVRDVSPAPRTNYYSWVTASNVPTAATTAAGTSVRVVGDKYVGGNWGNVAYATVTGSAKTGTARLTGLADLTVTSSLDPLFGPPVAMAAFPSGNGGQDEQILSAAVRGSRLWFSTNSTCRVSPDPEWHACARFVQLNLATSPVALADDASFLTAGTDTFSPIVGITRNGAAFMTMTRAAASTGAVMETYATYRSPGLPIVGGANEQLVRTSDAAYPFDTWPTGGSVVPDPNQFDSVVSVIPANCSTASSQISCGAYFRLRSGLADAPSGAAALGEFGTSWTYGTWPAANFSPLATSPIKWVRMSTTNTTEDTPEGARLVDGTTWPSVSREWMDLSSTASAGGVAGDTVRAWVQWGTGSAWSAPVAVSATIDTTTPLVAQGPLSFATGTVGATVPMRFTFSASDPESGIGAYLADWNCAPGDAIVMLPAAATAATRALPLGGKCVQYFALPWNGAGAMPSTPDQTPLAVKASQGTAAGLSYAKTWSTQKVSKFLGGSTKYATAKGAKATFTFFGGAVGFVTTQGPGRGKAEIWVDGARVKTIDLKAATLKYRQLVWSTAWDAVGTHTVVVKVLGTAGRPRVDVDAFVWTWPYAY
jgi:hypothetical protein